MSKPRIWGAPCALSGWRVIVWCNGQRCRASPTTGSERKAIAGGVRVCAGRTEAVLASGDWRQIVAVGWEDGGLTSRALGPLTGPQDWDRALACPG